MLSYDGEDLYQLAEATERRDAMATLGRSRDIVEVTLPPALLAILAAQGFPDPPWFALRLTPGTKDYANSGVGGAGSGGGSGDLPRRYHGKQGTPVRRYSREEAAERVKEARQSGRYLKMIPDGADTIGRRLYRLITDPYDGARTEDGRPWKPKPSDYSGLGTAHGIAQGLTRRPRKPKPWP